MGMQLDAGGGKRRGKGTPVKPAMNVTPLVDVVLVLLIIFMVITPLLTKQFWLNVPKKDKTAQPTPPPDDAEPPLVLALALDGTITLNDAEVAPAELQDKLARVLAARSSSVVFFTAADDVPYEQAIAIMDRARAGGALELAVLTEPLTPTK